MRLLHIILQNALCLSNLVDTRVASVFTTLNMLATRWAIQVNTAIQLADHAAEQLVSRILNVASTAVTISMNSAHITKSVATISATNAIVAHIVHATTDATQGNLSNCTDLIVHPLATVAPPVHATFVKIAYNGIKHNIAHKFADDIAQEWKDSPFAMVILVIFVVVWLIDKFPREGRAMEFSFYDLTTGHVRDIVGMQDHYPAFLDTPSLDGLDGGLLQPKLLTEKPPMPLPIMPADTLDNERSAYSNGVKLISIDKLLAPKYTEATESQIIGRRPRTKNASKLSQVVSLRSRSYEIPGAEQRVAAGDPDARIEQAVNELETTAIQDREDDNSKYIDHVQGPVKTAATDALDGTTADQETPEAHMPDEDVTQPTGITEEHKESIAATSMAPSAPAAEKDDTALILEDTTGSSSQPEPEAAVGAESGYDQAHQETLLNDAESELGRVEDIIGEEGHHGQAEEDEAEDEIFIYPGSEADVHARDAPRADGDNHAGPSTSSLEEHPVTHTSSSSALRPTAREFAPAFSAQSHARERTSTAPDRPANVIYVATPRTPSTSSTPSIPSTPALTENTFNSSSTGSDSETSRSPAASSRALKKQPEAKQSGTNAPTRRSIWDSIHVPQTRRRAHAVSAAQSVAPHFPIPTWESPERENFSITQVNNAARQGVPVSGQWRDGRGGGGPSQGRGYAPRGGNGGSSGGGYGGWGRFSGDRGGRGGYGGWGGFGGERGARGGYGGWGGYSGERGVRGNGGVWQGTRGGYGATWHN